MKGVAVTFMLIMIVTVLLISILVGWTVMNTFSFFEINEINTVKKGLEDCNDKIIETARTGVSNKCIFSLDMGELRASREGLNYAIISPAKICDKHSWVMIQEDKHLWQKCDVSGKNNILQFELMFPSEIQIEGQGLVGNLIVEDSNMRRIYFDDPASFQTLNLSIEFDLGEEAGVELVSKTGSVVEISRLSLTADKIVLKMTIR